MSRLTMYARLYESTIFTKCMLFIFVILRGVNYVEGTSDIEDITSYYKLQSPNKLYVEYISESNIYDDHVFRHITASDANGKLYMMGSNANMHNKWKYDPFCQEYYINDGVTYHIWPFNRAYKITTVEINEMIQGTVSLDPILYIMPWFPLKTYRLASDGNTEGYYMPIVDLLSDDNCTIENGDTINNIECLVINIGDRDKIWLANRLGYCVMKRVITDNNTGNIIFEMETYSVIEVNSAIWLPAKFVYKRYDIFTGKKQEDCDVDILQWKIGNIIDDKAFKPEILPGSIQYITDREYRQVNSGGLDLLDDVSNCTRHIIEHFKSEKNEKMDAYEHIIHTIIALIGGIGSGVLLNHLANRWVFNK